MSERLRKHSPVETPGGPGSFRESSKFLRGAANLTQIPTHYPGPSALAWVSLPSTLTSPTLPHHPTQGTEGT